MGNIKQPTLHKKADILQELQDQIDEKITMYNPCICIKTKVHHNCSNCALQPVCDYSTKNKIVARTLRDRIKKVRTPHHFRSVKSARTLVNALSIDLIL